MCFQKFLPPVEDFLKSVTGQLPRLPSWHVPLDSYVSYLYVLAEISPSLQIFQNLPLDSYLSYLHVLAEITPSWQIFWNLPQNSYLHFLHVLAEIPFHLQIFWNLPLDSYLSYQHVLTEICPTSLQIFWNLPMDRYLHMLAEISSFADFPKSATGQLPKLPTCACRNSPRVCRFSEICHWTVT